MALGFVRSVLREQCVLRKVSSDHNKSQARSHSARIEASVRALSRVFAGAAAGPDAHWRLECRRIHCVCSDNDSIVLARGKARSGDQPTKNRLA